MGLFGGVGESNSRGQWRSLAPVSRTSPNEADPTL